MSVQIPVHRQGAVVAYAIVDDEDAHRAAHFWRWMGPGYVARAEGSRTLLLHREVVGLSAGDGLEADHINRNKLDCRRSNLRVVTHAQNRQNNDPAGNRTWQGGPTTSTRRGVSWDRRRGKWKATVTVGGRTHHLGRFDSEQTAAAAADAFRAEHMPFAELLAA